MYFPAMCSAGGAFIKVHHGAIIDGVDVPLFRLSLACRWVCRLFVAYIV